MFDIIYMFLPCALLTVEVYILYIQDDQDDLNI